MNKNITVIILTLLIVFNILSCETFASSAQRAGEKGTLREGTANALARSARSIKTAFETITPEQEYYIGRAVAANILTKYKIWNGKPALTSYLNKICLAITVNSSRSNTYNGYRVAILDSNEINAFATSGGHIFITRGLVATAKTEDALASVIAHEVAHIQLKHGIKAIKSNRVSQALSATGSVAVEMAAGAKERIEAAGVEVNQFTYALDLSVNDIVKTMADSGYSQAQELEADNTAMALMAAAGYNPSGLIDMLEVLKTVQTKESGFGKTHPSPATRIRNAKFMMNNYNKLEDTSSKRQSRFTTAIR